MQYKKISLVDWYKQLRELRADSKRPFSGYLDSTRVSYDLSVLREHPCPNGRQVSESSLIAKT